MYMIEVSRLTFKNDNKVLGVFRRNAEEDSPSYFLLKEIENLFDCVTCNEGCISIKKKLYEIAATESIFTKDQCVIGGKMVYAETFVLVDKVAEVIPSNCLAEKMLKIKEAILMVVSDIHDNKIVPPYKKDKDTETLEDSVITNADEFIDLYAENKRLKEYCENLQNNLNNTSTALKSKDQEINRLSFLVNELKPKDSEIIDNKYMVINAPNKEILKKDLELFILGRVDKAEVYVDIQKFVVVYKENNPFYDVNEAVINYIIQTELNGILVYDLEDKRYYWKDLIKQITLNQGGDENEKGDSHRL